MSEPPVLIVTDVGARLVRRGLLTPDAAAGRWRRALVLVFRYGPVVCEPPPGALTCPEASPTFHPPR